MDKIIHISNFWGEVDESSGFYKRSWDYMELVERNYKGYWNVNIFQAVC